MPRTYPKNPSFPRHRHQAATNILPILLLAAVSLLLPSTLAGAEEEPFIPDWFMVIDGANLLDEGQERSAIDAALRLNVVGLPTQVIIELAQSTPQLASDRATELRRANAIESAPGADDGILLYAAVNPGNRSTVEVTISMGTNAVPRGGLTNETDSNLRSTIIEPHLRDGHPARAIVYTLRELHYLQIFTPPPRDALEGWRSSLGAILAFAAPVIAPVTAAGVIIRTRTADMARDTILPLVLAGALAILLAVLSVLSYSRIGILGALMLAAVVTWSAIRLDRPATDTTKRVVTASSRPPGLFRPPARPTCR